MKRKYIRIDKLERDFPSLELAYSLAVDSYKVSRERFDAMEKRGQAIIVFVTTITLAILAATLKVGKPISIISMWFVLAILSYTLTLLFGIFSQLSGTLTVLDPNKLWEKTLTWSKSEFQKNIIFWSKEHYTKNLYEINKRAEMINHCATFGLVTLLSLALWLLFTSN